MAKFQELIEPQISLPKPLNAYQFTYRWIGFHLSTYVMAKRWELIKPKFFAIEVPRLEEQAKLPFIPSPQLKTPTLIVGI